MKTIVNTSFATVAIAFTASASPALLVETTVAEHHGPGSKDVFLAPRTTVESGQSVTLQVGNFQHIVTPTLNENGSVDLSAAFARLEGSKAEKPGVISIKMKLGQVAEIQVGQVALTTRITLAK